MSERSFTSLKAAGSTKLNLPPSMEGPSPWRSSLLTRFGPLETRRFITRAHLSRPPADQPKRRRNKAFEPLVLPLGVNTLFRPCSALKACGVRVKDGGLGPDGKQEVEKPQMVRPQVVLGFSKLSAFLAAGDGSCEGGCGEL